MAGSRMWLAGLAVVVLMVAAVDANDCCSPSFNPQPRYPQAAPFPYPLEPQVPYACPTPAPPSPGPTTLAPNAPFMGPAYPEPPLAKPPHKGPMIYQNRVFSGVPQLTEARTSMCKVSFWNLKGADVTLTVGDRTHNIPRDRAVILELPRSFNWRTSAFDGKTEDVSDDLNHFEVMIK
jgi:hypothetical protein